MSGPQTAVLGNPLDSCPVAQARIDGAGPGDPQADFGHKAACDWKPLVSCGVTAALVRLLTGGFPEAAAAAVPACAAGRLVQAITEISRHRRLLRGTGGETGARLRADLIP